MEVLDVLEAARAGQVLDRFGALDQQPAGLRRDLAGGAANHAGQIEDQAEVVLAADSAAAGHDDPRALEVQLAGLDVPLDELQGQHGFIQLDRLVQNLAGTAQVGLTYSQNL